MESLKDASIYLFQDSQAEFYKYYDFSTAPPTYAFILYAVGFVQAVFGLAEDGFFFNTLVKLPPIIADIMLALFIYKLLYSRMGGKKALALSITYLLNPAILAVSSVWGQYDSIFAYLLVVSVYKLTKKDYLRANILYVLALLAKPLAVIYLPLYLFAAFLYFKENKNKVLAVRGFVVNIAVGALIALVVLFPFLDSILGAPEEVIGQILEESMDYASINAYNLFSFLDANWTTTYGSFLFMDYRLISNIALTMVVVFVIFLLAYTKNEGKFFISAAFISVCYFMFTIRMHERYFFVSIALLLITYVYIRDKLLLLLYGLFSASFFINIVDVIYLSYNENDIELVQYPLIIFSLLNIILTVFFLVKIFKHTSADGQLIIERKPKPFLFVDINKIKIEGSEKAEPFIKKDLIYISVLTLVYAVVAYTDLGYNYSPQSRYDNFETNSAITIELEEPGLIERVQYFLGPRTEKEIYVEVSGDGQIWESSPKIVLEDVFAWKDFDLNLEGRYIRIINKSDELMLMEMAIRGAGDELLKIKSVSGGAGALFDEQSMVPTGYTYMNSTYFDEVYHPRTAYEFVEKLEVYEWTHPHLGKIIMSIGVLLFGMTPFGWRFSGTTMGVLMLPVFYLFAKRVFRNRDWALFATSVFALDFMHYVQTRIGTIDSYTTFFVIGMFYYMYQYYKTSFYDTPLKKTLLQLFMGGLFMSLAIAAKWQGVYAAAGIAIVFFITLGKRFLEYLYAKQNGVEKITKVFVKNTLITLACCIVFFIIMPAIVYVVSYIPHFIADEGGAFAQEVIEKHGSYNLIAFVIENQIRMFNYHAHLGDTHIFASRWFLWVLDLRPMAFYRTALDPKHRGDILTFGNPALYWGGLIAIFYLISRFIKDKDKTVLFLLIGYFSNLVPWMLITTRTSFIYHYFPCAPFLALFVAAFIKRQTKSKKFAYAYIALALILFIGFYPVLSGMQAPTKYLDLLRWFPTW
ncbi:MAG: phospholipid carrier-dependent glycosyltransferase [Clostridiales bacterium]|nr:phospholipid carrier-dependent glycosyltransferase [Clostridiales bacterium]